MVDTVVNRKAEPPARSTPRTSSLGLTAKYIYRGRLGGNWGKTLRLSDEIVFWTMYKVYKCITNPLPTSDSVHYLGLSETALEQIYEPADKRSVLLYRLIHKNHTYRYAHFKQTVYLQNTTEY